MRPALRPVFVDLCRGTVGDYLDRFGFNSDLVKAMYAVTDGFSGLDATWDTPGTGMNFLVHNMCRLPGADGTWMIVRGGMGTVTSTTRRARARGRRDASSPAAPSPASTISDGAVRGVVLEGDRAIDAAIVVVRDRSVPAAPARRAPTSLPGRAQRQARQLDAVRHHHQGEPRAHRAADVQLPARAPRPARRDHSPAATKTTCSDRCGSSYADVKAGKLADFPTIEWYIHTTVDPSLQDADGHHSSALFVQWVPYELAGSTWDAGASRLRRAAAVDLRSLRARHLRPGRRHVRAGATRHRGALRHHPRAHPPRRQRGRVRRPNALFHRHFWPLRGRRRLPSGGLGHRRGRPQRRDARAGRSRPARSLD